MKHLSKLFLTSIGMIAARCPDMFGMQHCTREQIDKYKRQKEQQRRTIQENRKKRSIVDFCKDNSKLLRDGKYIQIVSSLNGLELYKSVKTSPKRVWQDYILFLFGMNLEDLERHKEYILKIE